MAKGIIVVDVRQMPEVIWNLRKEIASILREEAEGEAIPQTQRRLRAIAAAFEAGARPNG